MDLGSLKGYMDTRSKLEEGLCRWIARELCTGLQALHDKNLIHRDVKPANILLSTSSVKICDFGILHHSSSADEKCTLAAGTLKYFSPERLEKSYGTKADVWGLGIVLFEMAMGALPSVHDLEQELMISDATLKLAP